MVLNDFRFKTYDKVRFSDTDKQGHVNNAVFSTYLETGRTEILYGEKPLHDPDCTYVIANLELDYLMEIHWPGRVDIGTNIIKIGNSSMTLEQALYQNNQMVAKAKTVVVHVDGQTKKSRPIQNAVKEYINREA